MERFNIDFSEKSLGQLSKSVGERMKAQLLEKLAASGLAERVKLTFVENGHGVPVDFHLRGSADDVAAAKKALRLTEEKEL